MPLRKKISYQTRYFLQAVFSWSLPEWSKSTIFRLGLLSFLGVLSVLYVVQMSKAAVSGYQIHALEEKVALATKEKERLDVAILEQSSLSNLNKRIDQLQMVPAQNVAHLSAEQLTAFAGH
jgi:hypothetical protein